MAIRMNKYNKRAGGCKKGMKLCAPIIALSLCLGMAGCGAGQSDEAEQQPVTSESTATENESGEAAESFAENESGEAAETSDEGTQDSEEAAVEVSNSYDNTEELLKKFPVTYPTPIDTKIEKDIQNRLLNGFENWNRGFDAWKAWGDILYTEDSMYNVHDARLTLKEYQDAMNIVLSQTDNKMGNFENMIVCDDWTAIRYNIMNYDLQTGEGTPGCVMEFVNFKDYGSELGTRVVEGWAGTKGADFDFFSSFKTDEEKEEEEKELEKIANWEIPDTDNLEEKYPVLHKTDVDTELGNKIRNAILEDFEHWNQGYDTWSKWADSYYDSNLTYNAYLTPMTLDEVKEKAKEKVDTADVKKVYFDNMLISGDWAAIHYRVSETDLATGEKSAWNRMEFLHFAEDGEQVKVTECWTMEGSS